MENLPTELGHMCLQCSYRLDEQGSEVFDNLVQLENSLTISTKTALVYIVGYVTRKMKSYLKRICQMSQHFILRNMAPTQMNQIGVN